MAVQFRNRIGGWRLMVGALAPQIDTLPDSAEMFQRLQALIAEADVLVNEQEALRTKLRETVKTRREMEQEGEELRQRLAAALQAKHGFKALALLAFGVQPRRTPDRTTKAEAELAKLKAELEAQQKAEQSPPATAPAVSTPPEQ